MATELCMRNIMHLHMFSLVYLRMFMYCTYMYVYVRMYVRMYVCVYVLYVQYLHLYPGEGANYGWIKGICVLTFVM